MQKVCVLVKQLQTNSKNSTVNIPDRDNPRELGYSGDVLKRHRTYKCRGRMKPPPTDVYIANEIWQPDDSPKNGIHRVPPQVAFALLDLAAATFGELFNGARSVTNVCSRTGVLAAAILDTLGGNIE